MDEIAGQTIISNALTRAHGLKVIRRMSGVEIEEQLAVLHQEDDEFMSVRIHNCELMDVAIILLQRLREATEYENR